MTEPTLEPLPSSCSWPVAWTSCDCEIPVEERDAYVQMATDLLNAWTGGVYGSCEVTLRPCRADCDGYVPTFWGRGPFPRGGGSPWQPVVVDGQWINLTCGQCGTNCSCDTHASIGLPGPVGAIVEVLIDGVLVDPTTYRVDNHRYLVRTDGGIWPSCQDVAAPSSAEGTWQVTYLHGLSVPLGGQVAAARLACELWKAACGDASCQLPRRVQSITRQGVTIGLLDSFDDIDKGRTGIWTVDSWVASVTRVVPRGGQVFSVDRPRTPNRRQTWP
jgi:hypothetical protein